MNDVDKSNLDDLDLLQKEIKDDLLRELVINALADVNKKEQEAINQKTLNHIKQRYKEDLKNLPEKSCLTNYVSNFNLNTGELPTENSHRGGMFIVDKIFRFIKILLKNY